MEGIAPGLDSLITLSFWNSGRKDLRGLGSTAGEGFPTGFSCTPKHSSGKGNRGPLPPS